MTTLEHQNAKIHPAVRLASVGGILVATHPCDRQMVNGFTNDRYLEGPARHIPEFCEYGTVGYSGHSPIGTGRHRVRRSWGATDLSRHNLFCRGVECRIATPFPTTADIG